MPPESIHLESLKYILENSLYPQHLDTHPWATSLVANEADPNDPDVQGKSPGQRLVSAVGNLFIHMMPSTAPRHGKRLDTRWGEFGILAAQYFAPLFYGTPFPASLREAWGRIDQSILLFAFGKSGESLSEAEKELYKLVGDELEVAPNSTLSDWNRKGLQHLAEMILARESYLSGSLSKPAVISKDGRPAQNSPPAAGQKDSKLRKRSACASGRGWFGFLLLGLLLLGLLLLGGYKARHVYNQAILVRQDAARIQGLITASGPYLERIRSIGPPLSVLKQDFETLNIEVEPFLWLAPRLSWVPVYGGDLASASDLLTLADSLLVSADGAYQAVSPLLEGNDLSSLDPVHLTEFLAQAQPQLLEAQQQLDLAVTARSHLAVEGLSPQVRDLVLKDVDPLMALMQDGLTVAVEFPLLMGGTSEGPKTYLLLVQNEDELRPTGGFITAIGTLLVQDGRISDLSFQNVSDSVDWSKPYPAAPWQLQQYMNSPVLILGDVSWFTDYPIAALYAETLYSYADAHSVDGVIAFDQQMLVELLGVTGPVQLEGVPYPIDSGNVIAYMRSAKTPTPEDLVSPGWSNKAFMMKIANALVGKIFSGEIQPEPLASVLLQALKERHLLLQLDNPSMTSLLARYRLDGAVRPKVGDFLMVADTNIGFNKTNAVVDSSLGYEVDLTSLLSPIGSLTVVHTNNAAELICKHWNKIRLPNEGDYPITDCYWNYLRVYMAAGTTLLDAVPQFVPSGWMIRRQNVPAQVDILDEGIGGVQAFGTLQVVPGSQTLTASFRFALPAGILETQPGSDRVIYRLLVQKQPGTLADPITIRVVLPPSAIIETLSSGAVIQDDGSILVQTTLRTDIEVEIVFHVP